MLSARLVSIGWCLAVFMITAISSGTASAEGVFTSDIQPLLARRCYACHGPDTQEADLRLDDRAAATTKL